MSDPAAEKPAPETLDAHAAPPVGDEVGDDGGSNRPRRGAMRLLLWTIVLLLVLGGAAVGLFLTPMDYDGAGLEEWQSRFVTDVPDEQNAWHDYMKLETPDGLNLFDPEGLWLQTVAWFAGPEGDRPATIDAAREELARHPAQLQRWREAVAKPHGRGDVDFSVGLSDDLPVPGIRWIAGLRLLASLEDPAAFGTAVSDTRHAICTLSDHGRLLDATMATAVAHALADAVAWHLALARGQLTTADRSRLDDELAAIVGRERLETAVISEMIWTAVAHERETVDFIERARHTRWLRVLPVVLQRLEAAAKTGNAQWRDRTGNLDFQNAPLIEEAGLSTFERIRLMPYESTLTGSLPIFTSLLQIGRNATTRLAELRVALRVEQYFAERNHFPDALGDLGEAAFEGPGFSTADDWKPGASYQYDVMVESDGRMGYRLGSVGISGTWDGWPMPAATDRWHPDESVVVVVPPRPVQ